MTGLIVWCVLIVSTFAQPLANPIRNFCRRYGHQTAVIDRKLFIDGGYQYANPILENPIPTINQGLLYGDLDVLNPGGFPTVYANLTKNSTVPNVAGGILWADQVNKVLWLYGGEYSAAPSTFQLWGYDVILNQWNLSTASSDSSSMIQRAAYGAGTTVNDLGKGFYYGGYVNSLTKPLWSGPPYATNSLIVLDMDRNTLTNKSGPYDGIGRAEGVMVSIPASKSGMLVYFGGVNFPYRNSTELAQSMDTILLYDIGDEKWYTQKAVGEIPANRRKFCGGVAWADDKSSYNIYIYGGMGFGENVTGFDDVYILTIPTFTWTKWYPEPGASTRPHGILSCNVIQNSQMIVMGGNFTQDTDCDVPEVMGMHNLNLGQNNPKSAKWYDYLPKLTTYVVPSALISIVGGTPTGGANKVSPAAGFNDSALKVYFGSVATYQARTPTRSIPSATNTPGGDGKGVNIGIIIGAAVGGLVVIIAAGLAIFCCRRRRSKKQKTKIYPPSPPPARSELPGTSHHNEMVHTTAQVVSSPGSSHSPIPSPFSTTPLVPQPPSSPAYAYPPVYPPLDSTYHQYYGQPGQQYPYLPHPVYGYGPHPPGPQSRPEGWTHYPTTQQYFPPPPDVQRTSPTLQEMPTVMSPNLNSMHRTAYNDGERVVFQPTPTTLRPSIRRREVGSTSSPTAETVTTHSDTASRV